MPSSQTNIPVLEAKIDELERLARMRGASLATQRHLRFLKLWREFAGKDVLLVIRPKGAIESPGTENKGRLVRATDQVAADLLALASARDQEVRLATEAEAKRFEEAIQKQRDAKQKRVAEVQARIAQAQLHQLVGIVAQHPVGPTTPETFEPEPDPDFKPAPGPDELRVEVEPEVDVPVSTPETSTNADPRLIEVAGQQTAAKLSEIGIHTLEDLAGASPDQLTQVDGIGPSRAAKLLVAANEALEG